MCGQETCQRQAQVQMSTWNLISFQQLRTKTQEKALVVYRSNKAGSYSSKRLHFSMPFHVRNYYITGKKNLQRIKKDQLELHKTTLKESFFFFKLFYDFDKAF